MADYTEDDFRRFFSEHPHEPSDSDEDDDPSSLRDKLNAGRGDDAFDPEYDLMLSALQRQLEYVEKRLGEFLKAGNDINSAGGASLLRNAQQADAALRRALRGARVHETQPTTALPSLLGKYLPHRASDGGKKSKYVNREFVETLRKREKERAMALREATDDSLHVRHHRRDGEQFRLQRAESVLGTYETCKNLVRAMRRDELNQKLARQRKEEQRRRERKEKEALEEKTEALVRRGSRKLPRSTLPNAEDPFLTALPKTRLYELAALERSLVREGQDPKQLWEAHAAAVARPDESQLVVYTGAPAQPQRNGAGDAGMAKRRPLPDIKVTGGSRAASPTPAIAAAESDMTATTSLTAGDVPRGREEHSVSRASERDKHKGEVTVLPPLPSLERALGGNAERVVHDLLPSFAADEPPPEGSTRRRGEPSYVEVLRRKRRMREEEKARYSQMFAAARSNRERALKLLETNPPLEMIMGGERPPPTPGSAIVPSRDHTSSMEGHTPRLLEADFALLQLDGETGRIGGLVPSHLLITDAEKLVASETANDYATLWTQKKRAMSGFDFDAYSDVEYGAAESGERAGETGQDGGGTGAAVGDQQALVVYGGDVHDVRAANGDAGEGAGFALVPAEGAESDVPRIEAAPVIVPLTMGNLLATSNLTIKKSTLPPRMWNVV
eukprot:Opistho-1_new@62581